MINYIAILLGLLVFYMTCWNIQVISTNLKKILEVLKENND